MRSVFVLFALFLMTFTAHATCLDAAEAQSVLQHYQVQTTSDDETWKTISNPGDFDLCNDGDLIHQSVAALLFLQDFPQTDVTADDFDLNVLGASPLEFFQNRIQTIKLEPSGYSGCSGNTIAFTIHGDTFNPNTMHVCQSGAKVSVLSLAHFLIHEARHIDGFPHVMCTHGLYKSTMACDPSYDFLGSYGAGTELLVKTARNTLLSPVIREEARGNAIADLVEHFNQGPLGIQSGTFLLSNLGTLSFFDGKADSPLVVNIPTSTKTVMRTDFIGFYDTLNGRATTYMAGPVMADMAGHIALLFRQLPAADQQKLLDVYYGDEACFLYQDSLHCEDAFGQGRFDWPMPAGITPIQFMPVGDSSDHRVYIVGENGTAYQLPTNGDVGLWKPEQMVEISDDAITPFLSLVIEDDGHQLGIARDGKAVWSTASASPAWTAIPQLQNQRFLKALGTAYWSPRLQEL